MTRRVVGAAAAIAFVNAVLVTPASQIIDDAFIFFRYADNFLAGHGLTWNPGGEPRPLFEQELGHAAADDTAAEEGNTEGFSHKLTTEARRARRTSEERIVGVFLPGFLWGMSSTLPACPV